MDHDLTYKTILNSIIPNKLFDDMACESCSTKFTLFKRKKQCKDCLRFYCTDCVIRRGDRVLSCDNCSMLSRRPLIKSQVLKMKSKDLKQYLIAKKVSLRGCVEKEDLVNILMQYVNGVEPPTNIERPETIPNTQTNSGGSNEESSSPSRRSRSPTVPVREVNDSSEGGNDLPVPPRPDHDVDIVEVSPEDDTNSNDGPEPVIVEQDHDSEYEVQDYSSPEDSDGATRCDDSPPILTKIPSGTSIVKLTDVVVRSDLEHLNVKQLKDLLRTNRVDYRGCVERSELLDRACRLWDSHKSAREGAEVDPSNEDSVCKICWDSPIECVILECGHMACCIECGKQMNECPICRQYVVRVVRFFKA